MARLVAGDQPAGQVEAAGGVLWRPAGPDGVEVALVHRPKYDDWSVPKGKLMPGEHTLLGAVREVQEETGFGCEVGHPLGQIRYEKNGRPKRVRYWAMRATGGVFDPTDEVDEVAWVRPQDGASMLFPGRDRPVLAAFAETAVPTWTCLLVRHGSAGERGSFGGDDRDRPLDERGHRQADALARLLDLYAVERVLSADVVRCLDTVGPYAAERHLALESEPLVSESGFAGHPDAAVERLVQIIAGGRRSAVCSQGKAIPGLVAGACRRLGAPVPDDTTARKGGFWALHIGHGAVPRVVAAERFDPPG